MSNIAALFVSVVLSWKMLFPAVFLLRPAFVSDYLQSTSDGNLLGWETATVVTYLSVITGWVWIRLLGIGLLPLAILAWWFKGQDWCMLSFAQWGVLLSINTMPFGWSYDFVLLLFPMTQFLIWLITVKFPIIERVILWFSLGAVFGLFYAQRVATPSELFFYWVPLALLALYSWVAWRKGSVSNELDVRSKLGT